MIYKMRLRGFEKKLGEEFSDSLHHKFVEVAPSRYIIQDILTNWLLVQAVHLQFIRCSFYKTITYHLRIWTHYKTYMTQLFKNC